MPDQPLRQCREHERLWNGCYVDKNLKDEWLKRLNILSLFDLINICEGITETRGELAFAQPHVYCKAKQRYCSAISRHFNDKNLIKNLQNFSVLGETRVELDVKRRFFKDDGDTGYYADNIILKLTFLRERCSREIDEETTRWFEHIVSGIEAFDGFLKDLIDAKFT